MFLKNVLRNKNFVTKIKKKQLCVLTENEALFIEQKQYVNFSSRG